MDIGGYPRAVFLNGPPNTELLSSTVLANVVPDLPSEALSARVSEWSTEIEPIGSPSPCSQEDMIRASQNIKVFVCTCRA